MIGEPGYDDWQYGNYTEVTNQLPIKIRKKVKGNSYKTYTCSTTDMSSIKQNWLNNNPLKKDTEFPGWCPTEIKSKDGKIETIGLCSDKCKDSSPQIAFANINLLTEDECRHLVDKNEDLSGLDWKPEYEMCGAKKHMFPKLYEFKLTRKSAEQKKKDMESFKKLEEKFGHDVAKEFYKPTKYSFHMTGYSTNYEQVDDDYPFNWYLGTVDTCQGDSGGPMWRNIKVDGIVRATQLGVVSRGSWCGQFNLPGLYTRVSKIYDWIKETVEANSDGANLCPDNTYG